MLTIKWKGLDKLAKDLHTAKAKAVPYAIRTALTTQAFEARRIWQRNIREQYTLRNAYTERSIIAVKAHGYLPHMQSEVGSFAPYMLDQEQGGTVRGGGKHKAIPGPVAAGLAPGARRTRTVRMSNRLGALHPLKRPMTGTRARRNAAAISMAARAGKQVALLERKNGGTGLFRFTGGKQRWTGRKMGRRKVQLRGMLWDFSRGSVRVPAAHTLERTMKAVERKSQHMYQAALLDQLRKHRVLGY